MFQVVTARSLITLAVLLCLVVNAARAGNESQSPLADAVEELNQPVIDALLAGGADVNAPQSDGMTALHWAVYQDNVELSKSLIAAGANAIAANRYGITPLTLACTNGNAAIVLLLLEAGADPNTTIRGGETVLMTAARTGIVQVVEELVARGAHVDAKEKRGQTAIMWAAAEGHAEVVQTLLDAGADFRTPLPSGFTPLFFAVREGRSDVVQTLLAAGADVNEVMQPAKAAAGRAPQAGMNPLMLAIENGHFELAAKLLKAGADPNDQRSGFTPLHALTWVRKPNRGDGLDGEPAPIGSGNVTSLEIIRELVAHGVDVNAQLKKGESGRGILNRRGATPFLLAAKTADVPYLRLLLELGADPLLTNADNCTPLMAAAGIGTIAPGEEAGTEAEALEAAALILEHGGDVNAVDNNGETAMHGAAYKSFPQMVNFLAQRGAKVDVWDNKNKYGRTPLLIAQGYRVGNFKPNAETIAAIEQLLKKN